MSERMILTTHRTRKLAEKAMIEEQLEGSKKVEVKKRITRLPTGGRVTSYDVIGIPKRFE